MKSLTTPKSKKVIASIFLVSVVGAIILSACGGAVLNFSYDPTTGVGSGNIQVTGAAPQATGSGGGAPAASAASSQIVLFAVVVVLLIGTLAVVAASSRRRRLE